MKRALAISFCFSLLFIPDKLSAQQDSYVKSNEEDGIELNYLIYKSSKSNASVKLELETGQGKGKNAKLNDKTIETTKGGLLQVTYKDGTITILDNDVLVLNFLFSEGYRLSSVSENKVFDFFIVRYVMEKKK